MKTYIVLNKPILYTLLLLYLFVGCKTDLQDQMGGDKVDIATVKKINISDSLGSDYYSFCTATLAHTYLYDVKMGAYYKSASWSDNHNRFNPTIKENPMPDTLEIRSLIKGITMFYTYNADFYLTIKVQLKFGSTPYCTYVTNPVLSEDFVLTKDTLIGEESFFTGELYYKEDGTLDKLRTKSGNRVSIKNKFLIKQFMRKVLDKIDNPKIADMHFLNQIIVKTYMRPRWSNKSCYVEYTHPICVQEFKDPDLKEY